MASEPTNLQEAIVYFANPDNCLDYVVSRRWPNGVTCPSCGSDRVSFLANQRKWQCTSRHPQRQFSSKTGTIFEDSPLGLDKWLIASWMVANCKNAVSSYEICRDLVVTQKTAWFMLHRVRLAMQDENTGGKARNIHKGKRAAKIKGRGPEGKSHRRSGSGTRRQGPRPSH